MQVARSLPAVLASLLLGAHFLRAGALPLVGACLVLAALCFVRRPPVSVVVRVALVLGALEWIRTGLGLHAARTAAGEPALRALLILGAVAAFTAWAAWLLPGRGRPPP